MSKVLVLILVLLLSSCIETQCEYGIRNVFTKRHFSGVVEEIYLDNKNHAMPTCKLRGKDGRPSLPSDSLYEFVKTGDSIVKNTGTLRMEVYRNSELHIFYPKCGNILMLDDTAIYQR